MRIGILGDATRAATTAGPFARAGHEVGVRSRAPTLPDAIDLVREGST